MPAEALPHSMTRHTSAMVPVRPEDGQHAHGARSIDRYAYWSGGKRCGRCDVCGRTETIQGEVRTLVNGVITRITAIGDCGQWMFEEEILTDEQKAAVLAAAAKGREVPAANV